MLHDPGERIGQRLAPPPMDQKVLCSSEICCIRNSFSQVLSTCPSKRACRFVVTGRTACRAPSPGEHPQAQGLQRLVPPAAVRLKRPLFASDGNPIRREPNTTAGA